MKSHTKKNQVVKKIMHVNGRTSEKSAKKYKILFGEGWPRPLLRAQSREKIAKNQIILQRLAIVRVRRRRLRRIPRNNWARDPESWACLAWATAPLPARLATAVAAPTRGRTSVETEGERTRRLSHSIAASCLLNRGRYFRDRRLSLCPSSARAACGKLPALRGTD